MPLSEALRTFIQGTTELIKLEESNNYNNMLHLMELQSEMKNQTQIMKDTAESLSVVKSSLKEELSLVKSLRESLSNELGAIKSGISNEYNLIKQLAVAPADTSEKIFDISYTFDSESYTDTSFTINYDSSISVPCFYHSINNLSIRLDDLDPNNKIYTGAIINYTQSGNLQALVLDNIIKPYFIKSLRTLIFKPNVVYEFPIEIYKYMSNEVNAPRAFTPINIPTVVIYKDGVVVENQFDVGLTNSTEMISSYDCTITPSIKDSGEYTLSFKIGEVESNQINFSIEPVVLELPEDKWHYDYLGTLDIKLRNVYGSTCTFTLKKTGATTFETLNCVYNLATGIVTSTKQFSSHEIGDYELLVTVTAGTDNLSETLKNTSNTFTRYFTIDSPYNDTYNSSDKISVNYDTTFINNTTNEIVSKHKDDTFIPSTDGNITYSWSLTDGLEGTFNVAPLSFIPRRIDNVKYQHPNIHITLFSLKWNKSRTFYDFDLDYNLTFDNKYHRWDTKVTATSSNFSNFRSENSTHTIILSKKDYFQKEVQKIFPTIDFNHDVFCQLSTVSVTYKGTWGERHTAIVTGNQSFNLKN
jgi:hypothetical protein